MTLDAKQLLESPDLFPQRFSGADLIVVRMSRHSYGQSIFTDDRRIVTAGADSWAVPLPDLVVLVERHGGSLPAPAFIFHIAHCGSTLLSRAIDRPGKSLVIREPSVLRAVALDPRLQATGSIDRTAQRALRALLHMLSRSYAPAERVVLKANVPVNFMLDAISRTANDPAGVLLYCSLQSYLIAALKTPQRRAWATHVCRELANGIATIAPLAAVDVTSLAAGEAAALLWLAQMVKFEAALAANERLRALDCEAFYERPEELIERCCTHLQIDLPAEAARTIVEGALFTRHAKAPGVRYANADRLDELRRLRRELDSEISAATRWVTQIWGRRLPELRSRSL